MTPLTDLSFELRPPGSPVVAGTDAFFPLTVRNLGPAPVACVRLGPYPSSIEGGPFSNDQIWAGSLPAGAAVNGVARVSTYPSQTGELMVSMEAFPLDASDSMSSNNVSTASTTLVAQADLATSITGPMFFTNLTPLLSYEVQVATHGPSLARNVRVDVASEPQLTLRAVVVESGPSLTPCASPCVIGDITQY